jgi:hypothetical protein
VPKAFGELCVFRKLERQVGQLQATAGAGKWPSTQRTAGYTNGVILMLPPKLLQGLKDATAMQLAKVELSSLGTGLHCEALDADLGVAELAAGIFGSKTWMSELARFAGSKTSARKASSSRENGKRGGRPRHPHH